MGKGKLKDKIHSLEEHISHSEYEWSKERELYSPKMWEKFYKQKIGFVIDGINIEELKEIHRPLVHINDKQADIIAEKVAKALLEEGYIVETSVSTMNEYHVIDVYYKGKINETTEDCEEEHAKLVDLKLVHKSKFLHTYEATYVNKDGSRKVYEIISRNVGLSLSNFGKADRLNSDAVGMIIFNSDKSKVLLQKEFRMACGEWVYNLPGGLVDRDETVVKAAVRELKEETGLDLIKVLDILPASYTAVGLGNESVTTIIGIADGKFAKSTSVDEDIIPNWYTKEEVIKLIRENKAMSLRTQSFLYMWGIGGI